jgi:hypothetical protein
MPPFVLSLTKPQGQPAPSAEVNKGRNKELLVAKPGQDAHVHVQAAGRHNQHPRSGKIFHASHVAVARGALLHDTGPGSDGGVGRAVYPLPAGEESAIECGRCSAAVRARPPANSPGDAAPSCCSCSSARPASLSEEHTYASRL